MGRARTEGPTGWALCPIELLMPHLEWRAPQLTQGSFCCSTWPSSRPVMANGWCLWGRWGCWEEDWWWWGWELCARTNVVAWYKLFHLTVTTTFWGRNYYYYFLKILFIYSWETHRERQRHRQREKQVPCGEPDGGLDLRTPGSWPKLKADSQPLSHPGVPEGIIFLTNRARMTRVPYAITWSWMFT